MLALVRDAVYKFAHVLQRRGTGEMRWLRRTAGALACGLAFHATLGMGCAVDLRPAALPEIPDAAARAAGAARLAEMGRVQGLARSQRFSEARLRLVDSKLDPCLRGGLIPFLDASQEIEVSLALVRDTSVRARFVDGPRARETIGIKGDVAYRLTEDGAIDYRSDRCIEEYLRSLQRSLVLPLRLANLSERGEASAFDAGQRTLDGRSYDLVFVTTTAPYGSSEADEQYVLWIERSSGRVEWVEFTDRRRSRRAQAVVHYIEYRQVEGVSLPGRIEWIRAVGATGARRRLELREIALD